MLDLVLRLQGLNFQLDKNTEFLGPGTHVIKKILDKINPTSHEDVAAMLHDIDYLRSGEKFQSDYYAWRESGMNYHGFMLTLGLNLRSIGDALFHVLTPNGPNFAHFSANKDTEITPKQQISLYAKAVGNICSSMPEECDFVTGRFNNKIDEIVNEFSYDQSSSDELIDFLALAKKIGPIKLGEMTNMLITKLPFPSLEVDYEDGFTMYEQDSIS